jgi:hypothetical protein
LSYHFMYAWSSVMHRIPAPAATMKADNTEAGLSPV